jgi:hypothetical protein
MFKIIKMINVFKCNQILPNSIPPSLVTFPPDHIFSMVTDRRNPHVRRCMELPFQQTNIQHWNEVIDTLCNLEFIQAKAAAKLTYDLVKDFKVIFQKMLDNVGNNREELRFI